MKFNVYFNLRGPGGEIKKVPNKSNPVESEDLASLLLVLTNNLPNYSGIVTTGIEVEEYDEKV